MAVTLTTIHHNAPPIAEDLATPPPTSAPTGGNDNLTTLQTLNRTDMNFTDFVMIEKVTFFAGVSLALISTFVLPLWDGQVRP